MASAGEPESKREAVRKYRQRMRAQGLRRIEIWVPDVNSPGFREEARRQCLAVANSPHAEDDQAFIDSISDWGEE